MSDRDDSLRQSDDGGDVTTGGATAGGDYDTDPDDVVPPQTPEAPTNDKEEDDDTQQQGLINTQILNVSGNRGTKFKRPIRGSHVSYAPRVTRFLYAYFMFGFFIMCFLNTIWGIIGISYLFEGFPAIGIAYFGGLFIPSIWSAILLIFDFIIWSKNRRNPRRPLVININICCGRISYKTGRDMVRGWYFIVFLYIWFGVLLATPGGSFWLPVAALSLAIYSCTIIYDWELYYIHKDYNALYGIHRNPWRYLIMSSTAQFFLFTFIVMGHFFWHWRCIYEPEYYDGDDVPTHSQICHDWIPYELCSVVYLLLIFIYWYKRFSGEPLVSNTLDKRVRYYLWFQALLLFIAILWMIIEIFDGHVYVYDAIGFMALWFVCPIFFVFMRSFKVE